MVICIDTLVFSKDICNVLEKEAFIEGFKKIFDNDSYTLFIKDEAFSDNSRIALEYIKKSYRHSIKGESKLNILALGTDNSRMEDYLSVENDLGGAKKDYLDKLINLFLGYEEEAQYRFGRLQKSGLNLS